MPSKDFERKVNELSNKEIFYIEGDKTFDNRSVCLKGLFGSHNYNLNTENSDKDYKYFVVPNFDDLYDHNIYSHHFISNDLDFTVHDIRKLPKLLWNGTPDFIELLYSCEIEGFDNLTNFLKENRKGLSALNFKAMYYCFRSRANDKSKAMLEDSPAKHNSIKEYGFDVKNACHSVRLYNFLERMARYNMNVKKSLWYENGSERDLLLNIKLGHFTLEEVQDIIKKKEKTCLKLKEVFVEQRENGELLSELEELVRKIIKEHFAEGNL